MVQVKVKKTSSKKSMQDKVNRLIELQKEQEKLKEEMKPLREDVKKFMKETETTNLKGTGAHSDRTCNLGEQRKTNSTSLYTDYELKDLYTILGNDVKKVTEVRVNRDRVEGLIKSGDISKDLANLIKKVKIDKGSTDRFTIKK